MSAVKDPPKEKKEAPKAEAFSGKTGLTTEMLSAIFKKPDDEQPDGIKRLLKLVRSRVEDGRRQGLKNWRVFAAIDEAWNAPFKQISPTLIQKIISTDHKKLSADEIYRELQKWGLSEDTLLTQVEDEKGNKSKIVNNETFFKVLVPIVKSYTTVRAAKLFNDRNNDPFFVYTPSKTTEEDEVIGEVLTQLLGRSMVSSLGYRSVLRSGILKALKYSFAMAFPAEVWWCEEETDESGKVYTKREGIRYNLPHPSRCGFDQCYRPDTLNTDTGCEWSTYWDIQRFSDLKYNSLYYNTDKVTYGKNWYDPAISKAGCYFSEVYPCVISPPVDASSWSTWTNNREAEATKYSASTDAEDSAVFVTNLFCKINPKTYGICDYNRKVWIRFLIANDETIIWAEPFPYNPNLYFGYDGDDGISLNSSFALECLPWQDLTGNVLSQHLATIRQNLWKVIPYDSDQLSERKIKEIQANGRDVVQACWLPFSMREALVENVDPTKMFNPIHFGQQDANTIIGTLNTLFNVMERALAMSAQEVGAIAGHTQTAEEIRTVSGNTSQRVEYTGSFIDEAIDAWKRQLYDASQAFMDDDFAVQVNAQPQAVMEKLKSKLGFELSDPHKGLVTIKGVKSKLSVDSFLTSRENQTRQNNPQTAQVILQTIQAVMSNPEMASKVGVEWFAQQLNRAAKLAGAPDDFEIKISPEASTLSEMKAVQAQLMDAVKQITEMASQQATQQATQEVAKQVAPAVQETQQAVSQTGEQVAQTQQAIQAQQAQIEELKALTMKLADIIAQASSQQQPPPMVEQPQGLPAQPVAQPQYAMQ